MAKDRIELIARGVIQVSGHLLLCRNSLLGHAFLPGGHVDFAEKAREALVRELDEEAGLPVRAGPLLGVCESAFTQSGKHGPRTHHEINLVFLLTLKAGRFTRKRGAVARKRPTGSGGSGGSGDMPPPVKSREEHIEFFWVPISDLIVSKKHRPAVRVLPEGIVELAMKNIQAKRDTHALTVWEKS